MDFQELVPGRLVRRYKRFLAEVVTDSGATVTAHCPNTGAMTGLADSGSRVWLSPSRNPRRKLAWTWELVETPAGIACVHSALANRVAGEALEAGLPAALGAGYSIRPEVSLTRGTRSDFLLSHRESRIFVEVKAVTLLAPGGLGLFPDAVSERARRHVAELAAAIDTATRSALVFVVFHSGIKRVAPARDIDPGYARGLAEARSAGLELYGLACTVAPEGIAAVGECEVVV